MFAPRFLAVSALLALVSGAFALPTAQTQNIAARHGGANEDSDLFMREIARIAALQAREPTPVPGDGGYTPDYKRSPEPEPEPVVDDLYAREIARIREAEVSRRSIMEKRALDEDTPSLLSAELARIAGIEKKKREEQKADLLRREMERIAEVLRK